jgi:hypothetical protein
MGSNCEMQRIALSGGVNMDTHDNLGQYKKSNIPNGKSPKCYVEPYVDRGVDLFQTLGSLLNRLLDDSGPLEAVAVVLRIDRL